MRFLRYARRFLQTLASARRRPAVPPILGVRLPPNRTCARVQIAVEPQDIARIALAEGLPVLDVMTVPMPYWHLEPTEIPTHAWTPWATVPTGIFLQRSIDAGVRIGTHYTSGAAALERSGYDRSTASEIIDAFNTPPSEMPPRARGSTIPVRAREAVAETSLA